MEKWVGKSPGALNFTVITTGSRGKVALGVLALSRDMYTNCLPSAKQAVLKTYTEVTLNGVNRMYLEIHIYVQLHACMK